MSDIATAPTEECTELTWRDVHIAVIKTYSQPRALGRHAEDMVWILGTEVADVLKSKVLAEQRDLKIWLADDPHEEFKVEGARLFGIRCTVSETSDPRRIELHEVIGHVEVGHG